MISKISLRVWICLQRNLHKNERMKFKRKRKLCLLCFSVDGVLHTVNTKNMCKIFWAYYVILE